MNVQPIPDSTSNVDISESFLISNQRRIPSLNRDAEFKGQQEFASPSNMKLDDSSINHTFQDIGVVSLS